MSEPFGKRNRRTVTKPFAKPRTHKASTKSNVDNKVYVYVSPALSCSLPSLATPSQSSAGLLDKRGEIHSRKRSQLPLGH
jgi:hypothetical protein